ncbi:MAG: hypothetical protein CFH06_00605 [Alphaproteobacteria bacterium MarineAlpha3_Bin5]|nr:hypothetical protein [Magnetovibrio sp.]PPR78902.1 MAG: hypothetical protein CFH06_00605 [Alphaproteobacteria bacterium MarineAlpha3_Bin5]|tara:strand:- start:153 stop:398 length:246 start_codon:yes stop_codon:yes gene_type:complete
MRALLVMGLSAFLLTLPTLTKADDSHAVSEMISDNPGKSLGVAGCAAILAFPPAAAWCALTLVGGATIDGDTQKFLDDVTQ